MRRALDEVVNGAIFEEWEFGTLFGLSRAEVAAELATWPTPTDQDIQFRAVAGSLGNVLGYPGAWNEARERIGATEDEVRAARDRWRDTAVAVS